MQQSDAPRLSVIMSVYNGEEFVASAIESILNQTYADFEFIIINDGSIDGSLEIIRQFATGDQRIRIIDQANTGLTVALRRGISESRGELIARMDADDISHPTRFEKQLPLFDDSADTVAVTCHVRHVYDDGRLPHIAKLPMHAKLVPLFNSFCNIIGGHGQVMFRRSAYDAAGGYDPEKRFAQDHDLWARLTEFGSFAEVPEVLYDFRTGHDSISQRSKDGQAQSSIETAQREYAKLTGEELSGETGGALQLFWWDVHPRMIPNGQRLKISEAMDRAFRSFFLEHKELRDQQAAASRLIGDLFIRRAKRFRMRKVASKATFWAIALLWHIRAKNGATTAPTQAAQEKKFGGSH